MISTSTRTTDLTRGEIWTYRFRAPDKERPVLILTRPEMISVLNTVTVAALTRTIRGVASEVVVGEECGLKEALRHQPTSPLYDSSIGNSSLHGLCLRAYDAGGAASAPPRSCVRIVSALKADSGREKKIEALEDQSGSKSRCVERTFVRPGPPVTVREVSMKPRITRELSQSLTFTPTPVSMPLSASSEGGSTAEYRR